MASATEQIGKIDYRHPVQALLLLSTGRHAPGIRALIGGLLSDRAALRRSP